MGKGVVFLWILTIGLTIIWHVYKLGEKLAEVKMIPNNNSHKIEEIDSLQKEYSKQVAVWVRIGKEQDNKQRISNARNKEKKVNRKLTN